MKRAYAAIAVSVAVALALAAACSSSSSKSGSQSDASTDACSEAGPACPPMPLDDWTPPAYVHAATPRPSACPGTFISDFYTDCIDGMTASAQTCAANWMSGADLAHGTCFHCLVTPVSSPNYGPLIAYAIGTTNINVSGCIELLDSAHLSCAMALQAFDACPHQACDGYMNGLCTPNPADPSWFPKWQACVAAAQTCECASYGQAADCLGSEDAGPAAGCVTGQSTRDLYNFIAPLFCGSADGG